MLAVRQSDSQVAGARGKVCFFCGGGRVGVCLSCGMCYLSLKHLVNFLQKSEDYRVSESQSIVAVPFFFPFLSQHL